MRNEAKYSSYINYTNPSGVLQFAYSFQFLYVIKEAQLYMQQVVSFMKEKQTKRDNKILTFIKAFI